MLAIRLTGYDGSRYELPLPLRWDLTYTGGVPCDSMAATCLYDPAMARALPRAVRFEALRDGETMLAGVVDAYEISLSERGLLATVEGRGMAALLLDNESEAVTYQRAVTSAVVRRHADPYGIDSITGQPLSLRNYAVSAGSSQWKAIRDFTHRAGGFEPHFTREGTLVLQSLWGSGRRLSIDGQTPLLRLNKREERYGVISEVLIHDKVRGVRQQVVNQPFLDRGGCRRHVLYMPRSTEDDRRYTGAYQIAQSGLEQLTLTAELPIAFAAFPGDQVSLELKQLGLRGLYDVIESRCRMDESGERTELTLSER